jgi:TolB-like protein/Tfp pilus assembly protein PilF
MSQIRRLAAIMFTDIVDYTSLMQRSESEAIKLRNRHREVFDSLHDSYRGSIIQYYGDGTLSIFESAGDAVRCAIEIQRQLKKDPEVPLRIGIHLGDIIMTDTDIIGDSVNIASRIESLGTTGAVLISQKVVEEIKNQDNISCQYLGDFHFKNDTHPRGIYALSVPGVLVPLPNQLSGKLEQKAHQKGVESLAVLPFDNFTGDEHQEFMVAGIHDNLITAISRIGSLRVISKTSTLSYKNSKQTISEIARELRVDAIIEGSVSKRDNNILLNLQLLRAFPEEDHIWAELYDRPLEDVFALLNEITQTISDKIDLLLTHKESERLSSFDRVNPEAYQAYLRGKFHVEKLSYEALKVSMEYLEKAISIDPNFAPAYAAVASSMMSQVQMGFLSPPEAMPKIYQSIHKSLSLDPDFGEAHFIKGAMHAWVEWDWKQSEIEFLKAFDIDPNNSVSLAFYGHVLMLRKRFEEALQQVNRALELDPNNALVQLLSAKVFYGNGNIQQGLELAKKSFQIDPNNRSLLRNMDMCYYKLGDYGQSIEIQKRILRNEEESIAALEQGYADKDYKNAMLALARTKEQLSHQQFTPPVWVAIPYNRAGRYEDAIRWLERGLQMHDQDMPYIFIMHEFEQLRQDKRFEVIAQKVGVPM